MISPSSLERMIMLSDYLPPSDSNSNGVTKSAWHHDGPALSWGAIVAGAVAAAALSLILLILGTGLGLATVSPWTNSGISAASLGWAAIAWLTFTQLAASGVGGYLAGRLRRKWTGVHGDETYFRDTAHGFLSWAVATLVTAICLTSTIGSLVSSGAQAAGKVAGGAALAATAGAAAGGGALAARGGGEAADTATNYFVDALFRRDVTASSPAAGAPASTGTTPIATSNPVSTGPGGVDAAGATRGANLEVVRIFGRSLADGGALPAEDVKYVASLVAQRTGLSPQDAEARVNTVYGKAQAAAKAVETKARATADEARKASAYAALWLFVSLLLGAFVASFLATFGGKLRDH